jgi:CIC family chloride channel protein
MDERKWQRPSLLPFSFFFLSILVGVVAGLGAVVFRGLIAIFHNLFFLGKLSVAYDANIHTPLSPWGALVILVPVIGAAGVAFLVQNFAPEAKGHGVPEVMDTIYYHRGMIRPVVALIKSLASALSIGSGGSVGREGPIAQIGASFGSTVGQVLHMPTYQRIILIAAGTGGGIAATFNTPVGGVLFAIELMLHEISVKTIVPVVITTATATYVGQIFFGPHPSFVIPSFERPYFHLDNPPLLFSYVVLGVLLGVASTIFIKSIYGFEDFFEKRIKANYYVRHMIGMLLIGILLYILMARLGHYYIEGVGYAAVQDVLTGKLLQPDLLLFLFLLKLIATSLTLGSGASGGIFSHSLYLGATIGGAYGVILRQIFPELPIDPPAFAVAGMAGVAGGATGAPVTAIVMIFEMTLNYNVIIPMTITVALSYGVRTMLSKDSIYTMKLTRRGHIIPQVLQANLYQLRRAHDVMETQFLVLPASKKLDEFAQIITRQPGLSVLVVADDGGTIIGVLLKDVLLKTLLQSKETVTLGEIANKDYVAVTDQTTLFGVIDKMHFQHASVALVTDSSGPTSAGNVKGLITKEQIGEATTEGIDLFLGD